MDRRVRLDGTQVVGIVVTSGPIATVLLTTMFVPVMSFHVLFCPESFGTAVERTLKLKFCAVSIDVLLQEVFRCEPFVAAVD